MCPLYILFRACYPLHGHDSYTEKFWGNKKDRASNLASESQMHALVVGKSLHDPLNYTVSTLNPPNSKTRCLTP